MPTCAMCQKVFPNRMVVSGKTRTVNSRKYCLQCSPFGTHNTRRKHVDVAVGAPVCGQCGETDPSKFYGHKKKICGSCHNRYTLERGRQVRQRILETLGNYCIACGFNKYPCSLDVHHLDPALKDPFWGGARSWTWEKVEKEIAGCVLLCKNCHGAVHAGLLVLNIDGLTVGA